MKKEQFYFKRSDSEICYNKEYFAEEIRLNGDIQVYKAIPDRIDGVFWCKTHRFCGDDSRETCGKQCREYIPRNRKNGCCCNYTTRIYTHGDKVTLTL